MFVAGLITALLAVVAAAVVVVLIVGVELLARLLPVVIGFFATAGDFAGTGLGGAEEGGEGARRTEGEGILMVSMPDGEKSWRPKEWFGRKTEERVEVPKS